jgi:uncharacterized DUF497 family protein
MAKVYEWDSQKNLKLIRERGVSFEMMVSHIEAGNVIAVSPGKGRYGHQKQFIIQANNYLYVVPYVEDTERIFLKTIIPSRKLTKRYLLGGGLK